jgi:hypothetical protein
MEAIGSSQIVQDLFENYLTYVHEHIGDDNSSTKKVLQHSWQDEMDRGIRTEVLRYKNKQKKPNNRCLPIDHPSIVWLADKVHRVRQFASSLYCVGKKGRL